ncbi:MAG TPA: dual specificity protein phosphatase family protein [Coleofasciculaceae cyanobacterium]
MLRTFRAWLKGSRLEWIDKIPEFGNQDAIKLDSTPQNEQATLGSNTLPKIFITSCAEASKHLLCTTRGSLIKHLISIGSPGDNPPEGYTQVPHRLRLEFDDIAAPDDDPEYVLPTSEDIHKVIDFVPLISQDRGNVLIHCQAGISRSSAVALTVCAVLLGAGKEEEALAYVLKARPLAMPNKWIVELADEALGREGKLLEVVQCFHDSLWEDNDSDDWESI